MSTLIDIIPKIQEIKDHTPYHQTITLGPFERGYGHTLGNSLRRVLLSGMPGFAATEVEIEGVDHLYTSVSGISEDIIELVLNLKESVFRIEAGASVVATLEKSGAGIVTAGDIKMPGQASVINPDHYIATLAEDGKLSMKIKIEGGRGYLPASDPSRSKQHGKILLDAAFSPVKNVAIEVEQAREGSRTDLDRLVIDLKTNGVFSPEDLIRHAARILMEQLEAFAQLDRSGVDLDQIGRKDQAQENPHVFEPIDKLNLSVRVINNLKQESILQIGELVSRTEKQLMNTPRMGKKSVDEINIALAELDLSLGMDVGSFDYNQTEDK